MEIRGWIGVDLDGTLAFYRYWEGVENIGEPIPEMLERVKAWIADGREVRIFTARVDPASAGRALARAAIERWCLKHVGVVLRVTNVKDFEMIELWDDRAVCVERNTGKILGKNS